MFLTIIFWDCLTIENMVEPINPEYTTPGWIKDKIIKAIDNKDWKAKPQDILYPKG